MATRIADGRAISYGRRLSLLAAAHPARAAIIFVPTGKEPETITWEQLDRLSNQGARLLASRGVTEGSLVAVAVPNAPTHYVVAFATWKLGACVVLLNPLMPKRERDEILKAVPSALVVSNWDDVTSHQVVSTAELTHLSAFSETPLPDRVPAPGKAATSGGSTGRPKIIVDPSPWAGIPGRIWEGIPAAVGLRTAQTQLVAGPLYFNGPFSWFPAISWEEPPHLASS